MEVDIAGSFHHRRAAESRGHNSQRSLGFCLISRRALEARLPKGKGKAAVAVLFMCVVIVESSRSSSTMSSGSDRRQKVGRIILETAVTGCESAVCTVEMLRSSWLQARRNSESKVESCWQCTPRDLFGEKLSTSALSRTRSRLSRFHLQRDPEA